MVRPVLQRLSAPLALGLALALAAAGCRGVEQSPRVQGYAYDTSYAGPRRPLALGRFSNGSSYLRGVFTGGPDRVGTQARELLATHLERTNRFVLTEPPLDAEAEGLVLTGQVTELQPDDSGAMPAVRAAVALNVVELPSSRVVASVRGAGRSEISHEEGVRFRSTEGYDEATTAVVLDRALDQAVGRLVASLERGEWP